MARKRKLKPFRAVTEVKAAARQAIGTPKATRREPTSTREKEKHKPTLGKLLTEE